MNKIIFKLGEVPFIIYCGLLIYSFVVNKNFDTFIFPQTFALLILLFGGGYFISSKNNKKSMFGFFMFFIYVIFCLIENQIYGFNIISICASILYLLYSIFLEIFNFKINRKRG